MGQSCHAEIPCGHRCGPDGDDGPDRFRDAFEVFLVGTAERHADVIVPALRHETDRIAPGIEQSRKAGIVGGGNAGALRHAEGDELRAGRALLRKESRIRRIGARIAALDIVQAELVQHAGNGDLVLHGKVDAGGLLAVAQRGVEKVDTVFRHVFPPWERI